MKRIFLFLTLSLLTIPVVFSQTNKKLVVIITRANWCPTCRANEGKIKNELLPAYSNSKEVAVVINDVTNRRTKAKSKPVLQAAGVYDISLKEQATGLVTIINPATGSILKRLYVSSSLPEMEKAIADALAGI